MTIRDLPEVAVIMATEAVPSMCYPEAVDPAWVCRLWSELMDRGIAMCHIARTDQNSVSGWIMGLQAPDLYSGRPVALQQFWFVRQHLAGPSTAIRLMDAFIKDAEKRGCVRTAFGDWAPHGAKDLSSIYLKRGFIPTERYFTKELPCHS